MDVFTYANEKGEALKEVTLTKANSKMILRMTKENLAENENFISKPTNSTLYSSGDGLLMLNK